jgi:hypothetical protein
LINRLLPDLANSMDQAEKPAKKASDSSCVRVAASFLEAHDLRVPGAAMHDLQRRNPALRVLERFIGANAAEPSRPAGPIGEFRRAR